MMKAVKAAGLLLAVIYLPLGPKKCATGAWWYAERG